MRDCWVLVSFGPDPYCSQRPSCRPLARADLCPWAGFTKGPPLTANERRPRAPGARSSETRTTSP